MGARVGYVRVSSLLQNTERQLADIDLDRVFEDRISGKDKNRPALSDCLSYLREGDTLYVHSIDRLARNLRDLQNIVDELSEKGVAVHFMKENLIFNGQVSPLQQLMFQMLGAFGEFERNLIRERQAEGIAIAKQKGKYKGRKRALSNDQLTEIIERKSNGEKVTHLAREFGVSRVTIYKNIGDQKNPTAQI
ncbi:recombinase family protein [Desulfovibrio sp. JC010]|uniref:recombinase family protein n=1 Tax=Desulfovibrio sp. JC010 TaxID=2593641 RepID=UPI0013D7D6CF|nr:recombinase family protein [Desulfovibrio sp. JC010]NDV27526.1 recombinase family protein [Desulfovibrio sp. JC010]